MGSVANQALSEKAQCIVLPDPFERPTTISAELFVLFHKAVASIASRPEDQERIIEGCASVLRGWDMGEYAPHRGEV